MRSHRLICSILIFLTLCIPPAKAEEGYTDEDGNPIVVPNAKTAYSLEKPGIHQKDAAAHDPVLTSRLLVQGLETTRVLKITVAHPLPKTYKKGAKFPIKAIYLVDKDGIVVGYRTYSIDDTQVLFETKINGVINYLEIYVECREHGTWLKKIRLT